MGPTLPPHPKMYREAWVKPNPVKDLKQDCSTSFVLNPMPTRGHSILDLRIVIVLFGLHGGISHHLAGCPSYFALDYQALLSEAS